MWIDLSKRAWWNYVEEDLQELLKEAVLLAGIFGQRQKRLDSKPEFDDYAFIVFPAAKAYEGFLKKVFLNLNFIAKDDYYGKRFRIGKALNPSLEKKYRKESVYDKLVDYCKGEDVASTLWNTWKESRNLIFHWFPDEKRVITFEEAKERIVMIIGAIDKVFAACDIGVKKSLLTKVE